MSGAILSGIGAASAIGNILFGDAGPVVLGDFVFTGMEVPASIKWGGAHRLTIHRMPGGARVIDAMGRDDTALSWSGIMLGGDRASRAFQLDEMRVAGLPLPLSWGTHLYTVVIREFSADDVAFQVKYRISCEVLRDESSDPADAPTSLIGQITDDINFALSIAGPVLEAVGLGVAIVTGLQTVQGIQQSASTVTAGDDTSVALAAAVVPVQAAATAVVTTGDATIGAIALPSGSDPAVAAVAVASAGQQSGAEAAALAVRGLLGRITGNLSAVNGATDAAMTFATPAPPAQIIGGSSGTTVTQIGGNLFDIAGRQLGDATQWYRIAQATGGISDPILQGQVTLTIPDAIQAPSPGDPTPPGGSIT